MAGLDWLNALPSAEAQAALLLCCGSRRWSRAVAQRRPFGSEPALLDAAAREWDALAPADWLEAFAQHPRIGETGVTASSTRAWSASEQSRVAGADDAVRRALADANRAYADRFGYTFIVCATGKSAQEMLASLQRRLHNPPDAELRVAAAEQAQITRLRLAKLLAEHPEGA